jgi:hypothetical protein
VTAALVECCPQAIAIYWPAARHWLAPRAFAKRARERLPSGPPVDLWVDCRVWQLDKHTAAGFTLGLRALGYKEFEAVRSREPAVDLHERFEGVCSYVLVNGPIIRNGHTVGQNCAERIRVILCRSAHGILDTVWRLDYDEDFRPARPWWKLI